MEASLVKQLNQLLTYLHISIPPLESPLDLTPLLLLAILESLLGARLAIPPELRDAAVSKTAEAFTAKVQCMKIFLGVLESDMIQMDLGLSTVDPIRLAKGEQKEVVFVAEVLCWIFASLDRISTSPSTTTTTATRSSGSLQRPESNTSIESIESSIVLSRPPRCIHEVPSPSFALSSNLRDNDTRYADGQTVRYEGHIELVDHELEIKSIESIRSESTVQYHSHRNHQMLQPAEYSSYQGLHDRTVALLNERAALLEELAKIYRARAGR